MPIPTTSRHDAPLSCDAVAAAADALLAQCADMLRALPNAAYATDSAVIRGGSIGKHLRHTLDHFHAALGPVSTPLADDADTIDYDRRERHVAMESQPDAADAAIAQLRHALALARARSLDAPVRVRVMLDAAGTNAELTSTLGRELAFATHHAVHHQAMMKAIAAEFGVALAHDFGKAPSTLRFESQHATPR